MSDHQTIVAHTILLLVLAALLLLVERNLRGELLILHDRVGTVERGGVLPPLPVQGDDGEAGE